MIELPVEILKAAWVADVKASRLLAKRTNDHVSPEHLWDAEPDAEAGMRAAAEVVLRWERSRR